MQQIFNQELRFKDDNGGEFPEWQEMRLSDVLSLPLKEKPKTIDRNRLLTVKLHLKGVFKNDNTESLSLGANYFIRRKGQFIYGKQNLFNGAFAIVPDEFDGFLSSGDVPALDINGTKVYPSYLLLFMGRATYYNELEVIASGSGSKRIHESTLMDIIIEFPSLPEQQKIASFLTAIDNKIAQANQQLEHTQTFKKGLLQQMFV
jgi:type I restriction enzyme S subunit